MCFPFYLWLTHQAGL